MDILMWIFCVCSLICTCCMISISLLLFIIWLIHARTQLGLDSFEAQINWLLVIATRWLELKLIAIRGRTLLVVFVGSIRLVLVVLIAMMMMIIIEMIIGVSFGGHNDSERSFLSRCRHNYRLVGRRRRFSRCLVMMIHRASVVMMIMMLVNIGAVAVVVAAVKRRWCRDGRCRKRRRRGRWSDELTVAARTTIVHVRWRSSQWVSSA